VLHVVSQGNGVAQTFANTDKVLEALSDGVVVVDRSHWGRLRIAGKDRLDLLHNQSTAAFKDMKPGGGCDTVSPCLSLSLLMCSYWSGVGRVGDDAA
jgi:glycine cleavage system aminomethyltransferase T